LGAERTDARAPASATGGFALPRCVLYRRAACMLDGLTAP
jgi:hypothetical protein